MSFVMYYLNVFLNSLCRSTETTVDNYFEISKDKLPVLYAVSAEVIFDFL